VASSTQHTEIFWRVQRLILTLICGPCLIARFGPDVITERLQEVEYLTPTGQSLNTARQNAKRNYYKTLFSSATTVCDVCFFFLHFLVLLICSIFDGRRKQYVVGS
jgi:hypothetical protein